MKKQLFSILVILVLLLNSSVFTVSASEKLTLTISEETALPGEEINVTISVSNNTGLASLKFDIAYDSMLMLTNITFNSAFGAMVTAPEPYKNPEPLTMISPLSDVDANGVFATLTFAVSEDAAPGHKADITISYKEDDIYDGNYDNIPVSVTNGSVTVAGGEEEQAPFGFAGHQIGENGIRFIGYTNSLEYDTIDLVITVEEADKNFTKATTTVYTTLMGVVDGETKAVASCDPEAGALVTLDYGYLYGYAVTDIEAGEYVFTIVPTAMLNGEILVEETAVLNVTVAEDGTVTVTK